MSYRDNAIYAALEKILRNAGIKIDYVSIPEAKGRPHAADLYIRMPADPEAYQDHSAEYAAMVLGREAGHILSYPFVKDPVTKTRVRNETFVTENEATKVQNEALCDLIGVYLYTLADLTAAEEMEREGSN